MQMSFSFLNRINRISVTGGMICLVLAAGMTGCASKNPLMDDTPVATSTRPAKPVASSSDAAPAPAATSTTPSTTTATTAKSSGTHTTGPSGFRKFLGIFSPYRVDIQQGNFISREMVDQLKENLQKPEGVTREQVRFVLGTPLLTDIFHADRWDYAFRLQKKDGEVISSHVTAVFQNNKLVSIDDGGNLPTEQEYLALIAAGATTTPSTTTKAK